MAFYVRARDAAGYITLRRATKEAAEKKAEELRELRLGGPVPTNSGMRLSRSPPGELLFLPFILSASLNRSGDTPRA